DAIQTGHTTSANFNPNVPFNFINVGPVTVRGGRHTVSQKADVYDAIVEMTEADNTYQHQYVWSPLALTAGIANLRAAPPAIGTLGLPNCDGFSFTRDPNAAWVVGDVAVTNGDNYELYVYSDYANSTSGFSSLLTGSLEGGQVTDFVVGNYASTPLTFY